MRPWIAAAALTYISLPALGAQLLVDLRDDTGDEDEAAIEAKLGGLDLRLNSEKAVEERLFIADLDEDALERAIAAIKDDPRVEHAEPNALYFASFVPDDPRFGEQWSMKMVGATEAWEGATGKGAIVAVIDTGIAYMDFGPVKQVEDLEGARFVPGYDFVNDRREAVDDHGHGTHVAGTIAQRTNNGRGVAGLAYEASLMPLKVLSAGGSGTAADIADAIYFAADEGAHVINMSLGGGAPSETMASAVAYARKKGVVVVCAAGNSARGVVEYPAGYKGAFAVSAVGPRGELAAYSSWGKALAIAAPGGDKRVGGEAGGILQNTVEPGRLGERDRYLSFQGTSMATPHVAGAAALLVSAGVTDPDEVERILRESATPAGDPERYGAGVLNAAAAVEMAKGQTRGSWYFAFVMLVLALFGWRVGRPPRGVALGLAGVLGAVLAGSGVPIDGLGLLSSPLPAWDLWAVGPSFHKTALWASALPMGIVAVVCLGKKSLQPLIIGLSLGWAAWLVVSGVTMPADVRWMPGLGGALDRVWLFANAAVLFVLARLLARARA